ncbi:MAG: FMN-binding protein [Clostridia bacterium]|nr:FMN-binding protein [Clostridia bacterium]
MKQYGKSVIALVSICAVIALILACTNSITKEIIEENEREAVNESLLLVLPEGSGFEELDCSAYALPATVTDVYREAGGGYVFQMTTTGYSSGMVILCGVSAEGTVSGALCLSSTETLGYEKTYGDSVKGATLDTVDSVDAVSGATKTTEAYRNAVKDALTAFATISEQVGKGGAAA